jgi:hypothetical protein
MGFTRFQLVLLTIAVCIAAMCLGRLVQVGLMELGRAAHVAVHDEE